MVSFILDHSLYKKDKYLFPSWVENLSTHKSGKSAKNGSKQDFESVLDGAICAVKEIEHARTKETEDIYEQYK